MVGCLPPPMALGKDKAGGMVRAVSGGGGWTCRAAPDRVRVGDGAEDQSFLLLKCNKSVRELGGGQGSGDPAVQATGSCALRGTTTWGGGWGGQRAGEGLLLSVQLCPHLF